MIYPPMKINCAASNFACRYGHAAISAPKQCYVTKILYFNPI